MSATAIIPARFGATRFPGKILADETGQPLVQHVYEVAQQVSRVGRVIVAADDMRIVEAVASFGGEAVMTRKDHPNGTSRIAEAVELLNIESSLIVNVQGDEPEIDPAVIDRAILALSEQSDCVMSTLAAPMRADEDDASNPNVVKVVCDTSGRALYFSRSPIPFNREDDAEATLLRHVGLYVYRRNFLPTYVSLSPTALETSEQLEQLRVLEHGYSIAVATVDAPHAGIDTPEQYAAFVERWSNRQPG